MAAPEEAPDYFATCQLPSQQFDFRCVTKVIAIESVTATHPYHNEIKKLPKNHPLAYYSIQTQETPAFPLGGGQAGDQGTFVVGQGETRQLYTLLGTFRINNLIHHVVAAPKEDQLDKTLTLGADVTVIVDMARRLFLMHNHTTQHLLSAIFSQVFKFDTFGWTSGVYSQTPPQTLPFNAASWQQIQETISTIDFTGDFGQTMANFSFDAIAKFMINAAGDSYPFHLFTSKLFAVFAVFLTTKAQQDQFRSLILEADSFTAISALNFDALLSSFQGSSLETLFTFEHLALAVEVIANFIMTTSQPTEVRIEGLIEEPLASPDQTTSSMGSTVSSTDADGTVVRQNASKYSKYAKNGAVPKRKIAMGRIEASPCCGTHVSDLLELQSVSILAAFRHGGRWRISFTPAISALPAAHWSYQLADQLKAKFSCQFDQLPSSIDKTVATANSLKNYKTKIYSLVGKMLFDEYEKQLVAAKGNGLEADQAKILIHYNDAFLAAPEDLTNACYALSEACNAAGIVSRPILVMTTFDSDDSAAPGIFLVYGTEAQAPAVKALGNIFVTTLNCKGGGKPGVYQGKIPNWEQFRATKQQLAKNDQGWTYIALGTQ